MTIRDYKISHNKGPNVNNNNNTSTYRIMKSPASLPSLLFPFSSIAATPSASNCLDQRDHLTGAVYRSRATTPAPPWQTRRSQTKSCQLQQDQRDHCDYDDRHQTRRHTNKKQATRNRRSVKNKSQHDLTMYSDVNNRPDVVVLSPLLGQPPPVEFGLESAPQHQQPEQQPMSTPSPVVASDDFGSTMRQQRQQQQHQPVAVVVPMDNCEIDMHPASGSIAISQAAANRQEPMRDNLECYRVTATGSYTRNNNHLIDVEEQRKNRPQLVDFSCQTLSTTSHNRSNNHNNNNNSNNNNSNNNNNNNNNNSNNNNNNNNNNNQQQQQRQESHIVSIDDNFDDIIRAINDNNNNTANNRSSIYYSQPQEESNSIMLDIMNRFNIIRGRHQQSSLTTATSNSNLASRHHELDSRQHQQHQQHYHQSTTAQIIRYTPRLRRHNNLSDRPTSCITGMMMSSDDDTDNDDDDDAILDSRRMRSGAINHHHHHHQQQQQQQQQLQRQLKPKTVMCRAGGCQSASQVTNWVVGSQTNDDNNQHDQKRMTATTSYKDTSDTMTICSTGSSQFPFCKICHVGSKRNDKLISPCKCSGTMQYIHCGCLLKWLEISNRDTKKALSCELCNYEYLWHTKFDLRCRRLPNCSFKDMLLHTIFVACLLIMLVCAIVFVISVNDTATTNRQDHYHHHHQQQQQQKSYQHRDSYHHQMNHNELSAGEKMSLLCGATLFISFFLAMYVQMKAKNTLYKLFVRFIYLNQKFYITEYDHHHCDTTTTTTTTTTATTDDSNSNSNTNGAAQGVAINQNQVAIEPHQEQHQQPHQIGKTSNVVADGAPTTMSSNQQ